MAIACISCDCNTSVIKSYTDTLSSKEYDLLECSNCCLQFWYPLEQPDASYYEKEIHGIYKQMHQGRSKMDVRYKEFLKDFPGISGKIILDIGCSDGLFLEIMHSLGNTVYGIDIDSISIEKARQRGLKNIYLIDINTFAEEALQKKLSFDIITMFDVIEHLVNPIQTLASVKKLLSSKGILVGTVPNGNRFLKDSIETDFPPHHFYRFNKKSLTAILAVSDFSVAKMAVIEYGYSGRMLLKKLLKKKKSTADTSFMKQSSDTYSDTDSVIGPPNNSNVPKKFSILLLRAIKPFSLIAEKSFEKGFKLYFVSHLMSVKSE